MNTIIIDNNNSLININNIDKTYRYDGIISKTNFYTVLLRVQYSKIPWEPKVKNTFPLNLDMNLMFHFLYYCKKNNALTFHFFENSSCLLNDHVILDVDENFLFKYKLITLL